MRPETIFILAVAIAVVVIVLAIRKSRKQRDASSGEDGAKQASGDG